MKNSIKINTEFNLETSVYCNKCKRKVYDIEEEMNLPYIEFDVSFSYPSKFDNEKHSFQMCEFCYENFISNMKLPVSINNRIN